MTARDNKRIAGCFLLLAALTLLLAALNLAAGSTRIGAAALLRALFSGDGSSAARIVWDIRMPRLLAALHLLADKGVRDVEIRIPAANEKAYAEIERLLRLDPPPAAFGIEVVRGKAREILRHADCAAVASGTATLEAALARCPTVLVYAVSPLFAWIARRVIKGVRHVGLANVIAEKAGTEPPMPELLQEAFTPGAVADHLARWLGDAAAREEAVAALDATMALLKSGGDALGLAAREVLAAIHENRQGDT